MIKKIALAITFLTGLGLIFIGARFLLSPQTAEADYGIHFDTYGDYAFHYIKGIRDVFTGLLLGLFIVTRQTKALATTLIVGTIIPFADMLIVLNKDYNGISQAIPHIAAVIVCSITGIILLYSKSKEKTL